MKIANIDIIALYTFELLSEDTRKANKIRSSKRLDCVSYVDLTDSGYRGLDAFRNKSNQMCLTKTDSSFFVKKVPKQLAQWCLVGNGVNLSSVYYYDITNHNMAYGFPSQGKSFGNGKTNPLYEFRNDAYLFIVDDDFTRLEVVVIKDARNILPSCCQMLFDGKLDSVLSKLRSQQIEYYNYI